MNTTGGTDMNVIKYYGSLMEGPRVWIIMELAEGGSIRTLVSNLSTADPNMSKSIGLTLSVEGTAIEGASHLPNRARGPCSPCVPAQERRDPS